MSNFSSTVYHGEDKDLLSSFWLVFIRLFLYRSVQPFKCPVIVNLTPGLIFGLEGNI